MKQLVDSFKIAFLMYSKIPMPYVEWKEENMKYAMCFFPLVGAVIGSVMYGVGYFITTLSFGSLFTATLFVLIPIFVTGGIHVDGFLDTSDAISSYQPVERRLEILKDPHTGAFAIISAVCYFLIALGVWSEVTLSSLSVLCIGFVISRAFSGLSIVTFPMAKTSGLAAMFSNRASKRRVQVVMCGYLLVCGGIMIWIQPILGSVAILSAIVTFGYYYRFSKKNFGGITGDLAGCFLQICELTMAVAVIIAEQVVR